MASGFRVHCTERQERISNWKTLQNGSSATLLGTISIDRVGRNGIRFSVSHIEQKPSVVIGSIHTKTHERRPFIENCCSAENQLGNNERFIQSNADLSGETKAQAIPNFQCDDDATRPKGTNCSDGHSLLDDIPIN